MFAYLITNLCNTDNIFTEIYKQLSHTQFHMTLRDTCVWAGTFILTPLHKRNKRSRDRKWLPQVFWLVKRAIFESEVFRMFFWNHVSLYQHNDTSEKNEETSIQRLLPMKTFQWQKYWLATCFKARLINSTAPPSNFKRSNFLWTQYFFSTWFPFLAYCYGITTLWCSDLKILSLFSHWTLTSWFFKFFQLFKTSIVAMPVQIRIRLFHSKI